MRPRIAHGTAVVVAACIASIICLSTIAVAGPADAATDVPGPWGGGHAVRVAALSRLAAYRDRVVNLERMIAAWRAAHPAPAPPPPIVEAAAAPQPPVTDATSTTTPDWACIRVHESGDRYNTPAVPGGAYGFLEETWLSLGYGGWPYQAPPWVQSQAALFLYNELGWQPWSTRVVCGL